MLKHTKIVATVWPALRRCVRWRYIKRMNVVRLNIAMMEEGWPVRITPVSNTVSDRIVSWWAQKAEVRTYDAMINKEPIPARLEIVKVAP